MENKLKKILKNMIEEKEIECIIDYETTLGDVMTSIEIIELVAEVEESFDVFFDDDEIDVFNRNINEISAFLATKELKEIE